MRIEIALKLKRKLAEQTSNLYDNAIRFHWDAKFVRDSFATIRDEYQRKGVPQWVGQFVQGVAHECDRQLKRHLVYSYEYRGRRLTIDSDEYRKVPPQRIHEECRNTGCFVWKEAPNRYWYPLTNSTDYANQQQFSPEVEQFIQRDNNRGGVK